MMACIGRNKLLLFKLLENKIVAFEELYIYIYIHFNILLKHNGMPHTMFNISLTFIYGD